MALSFCTQTAGAPRGCSARSTARPVATASGSDFTEYPGKQDFLQLGEGIHTWRNLQKSWSLSYNLNESARHFRTRQAAFELLAEVTDRRLFADLCEFFSAFAM